jgi:hypothetical protein
MDKPEHSNWFVAYRDLAKTIVDFISKRADSILNWTGSEDPVGAEAFLNASGMPNAQAAPAQESQVKEN